MADLTTTTTWRRTTAAFGVLAVLGCWCVAAGADRVAEEADKPVVRGCAFRGRLHAVGERWVTGPPDKCAKYLCEDDDRIAALTCPWFVPAPGCTTIPGDESAAYPGCCPARKCHNADAVDDRGDRGQDPSTATQQYDEVLLLSTEPTTSTEWAGASDVETTIATPTTTAPLS